MKILMTGATAAQVSARKNAHTTTFAGLVHQALVDGGADVTWREPSVTLSKDYLAEFDAVLVGLAPPNSTAAHRIYGALSVIQYASELGTLRLMLDAPEPKKVWAGIRAVHNDPGVLTKDFYAKRREYAEVQNPEVLARLHAAVSTLYKTEWPKTIYPRLPWMSFPSVSTYIPNVHSSRIIGINLDSASYDIQRTSPEDTQGYWISDAISSPWTVAMQQLVTSHVTAARGSKWESDDSVMLRARGAIGLLMSTYKYGDPWWTPLLPMSLNVGIPIVTDWRLTSFLGGYWTILASTVEDLSPEERGTVASAQRAEYLAAIPTWEQAVELTHRTLFNS